MTEFESKTKAIKGQTTIVESETRSFLSSLQMFVKASKQSIAKMKLLIETYQKKESSSLSSQHQAIDEQMKKITAALKTLQSKEDASEQNLTNIWTIVKEVQDRLANELSIWSGSTQNDIKTMCADIEGSTSARFAAVSDTSDPNIKINLTLPISRLSKQLHHFVLSSISSLKKDARLLRARKRQQRSRMK